MRRCNAFFSAVSETSLPNRAYFEEKVSPPGSTLYYVLLYARADLRDWVCACQAIRRELLSITFQKHIDVAIAKLAWWRQELAGAKAREARHPATQLLCAAQKLNPSWDLNWVTPMVAHTSDLVNSALSNDGRQELTHEIKLGYSFASAICKAANLEDPIRTEHAKTTGVGIVLTGLSARHLHQDGYVGRPIASSGADSEYTPSNSRVTRARHLANAAKSYLSPTSGTTTGSANRLQPHDLVIHGRLCLAIADAIIKRDRPCVTPLRKLWIAWRTQRQLGKIRLINRGS